MVGAGYDGGMTSESGRPTVGSIQPTSGPSTADASADSTDGAPLWTCPRCGHRFVSANPWHSCSRHSVDEHFVRAAPSVRESFDRLVGLYERCGPLVVIAQKTRIVFMVRVRFGGCVARRDRLLTSVALSRRVEHARWTKVEELAPGWVAHHLEVRDPAELDDPELAALICESYHEVGQQRRLRRVSVQ
jgi:hypothetical protein